ncbi:hypothetical protein C1J03_11410 [Sulfitobacter sp. SK012]|uniref:hypothetical protein n=1 Tax=Sulfitobacter sp. SK012 TaxID=1389005 RepID=UPI000E0AECF1|nr:hypothetical protein [Sulfitobacter sp. SK012]AXI46571.1 hypothetical protein C1J03_11410 [Sulfitobacter sp. SK012]
MNFTLALLLLVVATQTQASQDYLCPSTESCQTETNCKPHVVHSILSIEANLNLLSFGSATYPRDTCASYEMQPNSGITKYIGLGGAKDAVGAQSFVLFQNMEFILTSAVQVEVGGKEKAVGLLVWGVCERAVS